MIRRLVALLTLLPASVLATPSSVVPAPGTTSPARTDADISSLAAGKYFVLFTDAEGNLSTKPFVKQ